MEIKNNDNLVFGKVKSDGPIFKKQIYGNCPFFMQDWHGYIRSNYEVDSEQMKVMSALAQTLIDHLSNDKVYGIYLDECNCTTSNKTDKLIGVGMLISIYEELCWSCSKMAQDGIHDVILDMDKMKNAVQLLTAQQYVCDNQMTTPTIENGNQKRL